MLCLVGYLDIRCPVHFSLNLLPGTNVQTMLRLWYARDLKPPRVYPSEGYPQTQSMHPAPKPTSCISAVVRPNATELYTSQDCWEVPVVLRLMLAFFTSLHWLQAESLGHSFDTLRVAFIITGFGACSPSAPFKHNAPSILLSCASLIITRSLLLLF